MTIDVLTHHPSTSGLASVALLMTVACHRAPPWPPPPLRLVHVGPERNALAYPDPRASEKRALLERINQDRAREGRPPLAYEPRAARAGDLFCLEAALGGSAGHWDRQGRPPYLRWALAGGLDYHAENSSLYSISSGTLDRPLPEVLLRMHENMMAERPPHDGHRRVLLDPDLTHVGIGLAVAGGEVRMTQEFARVRLAWMEVPDGPLPAGSTAAFAAQPLPGWSVGLLEVRYEPVPPPLSLAEVRRREVYGYPPVVLRLRPRLPADALYDDGSRGELQADRAGAIWVTFPLASGPGHYYVVCHVERTGGGAGQPLQPASAALITATAAGGR